MKWALTILAAVSLMELLTWTRLFWSYRKIMVSPIIIFQAVLIGLIFGFSPNVWTGLLLFASAYRIINLLRLVEGRTEPDYLFTATRKCSYRLIVGQIIIGMAWLLYKHLNIRPVSCLEAVALVIALVSLTLTLSTYKHLRTSRSLRLANHYVKHDLPTLSVLIPARNETLDLEECLVSLVSSDYPKLEILVLDDCSQNKHTPEIIKSFAQAGVRFVAGEMPPDSWLAKNYAYEQLASQANGEILLFCGVDTRFRPETLTLLVETLLDKKKTMASIMPVNKYPSKTDLLGALIQPSRYAWELSLPRSFVNRPAVLSTCWLIRASSLKDFGSFKAVTHSTSPESYFARRAIKQSDGYSFLRSSKAIGLTCQKTLPEQYETAIRTRYPQLHRRLELVGLLSLAELTVFIAPIFGFIYGWAGHYWLLLSLSGVSLILLSGLYAAICWLTYSKFLLRSLVGWPAAVLYDIGLLNYSMWQYEFRQVIWKGRNICLPVMRVRPD